MDNVPNRPPRSTRKKRKKRYLVQGVVIDLTTTRDPITYWQTKSGCKIELPAVREENDTNEDYGGTEVVESTAHRWPGTPAQEQGSSNTVSSSVQSATLPVVPKGTQQYNAGHPNMQKPEEWYLQRLQELHRACQETTDFGTADAPSAKRRRRH